MVILQNENQKNGSTPYKGKKSCFGEYTCPECSHCWMSSNSRAGYGQKCKNCDIIVLPHEQNPMNGSTPYKGKRRCFGQYRCPDCFRSWVSSNSWAGYGQKCEICDIMVLPHKQRPLRKPGGLDVINKNKAHPQHLCQKCTEVGHYCRQNVKSTASKINF